MFKQKSETFTISFASHTHFVSGWCVSHTFIRQTAQPGYWIRIRIWESDTVPQLCATGQAGANESSVRYCRTRIWLVQQGKTAGGKKDVCFRGSLELQLNTLIFQYHRAQSSLNLSPWVKFFELKSKLPQMKRSLEVGSGNGDRKPFQICQFRSK